MPNMQSDTVALPCSVRNQRTGKLVLFPRDFPHKRERVTYRFVVGTSHATGKYWLELGDLPRTSDIAVQGDECIPDRLSLFNNVRSFGLLLPNVTSRDDAQAVADTLNALNISWNVVYASERAERAFMYSLFFTPLVMRFVFRATDAIKRRLAA